MLLWTKATWQMQTARGHRAAKRADERSAPALPAPSRAAGAGEIQTCPVPSRYLLPILSAGADVHSVLFKHLGPVAPCQLCTGSLRARPRLLQPAWEGAGGSAKSRDQATWHRTEAKKGAKARGNKHLGKALLTCEETDDDTSAATCAVHSPVFV